MSESSPPDLPDTPPAPLSPARQWLQRWQRGNLQDVRAFLAEIGPMPAQQVAAVLLVDQRERWHRGQRPLAETYLAEYPELDHDPEAAVDLIYGEFLLRVEFGDRPTLAEYQGRFPDYADRLHKQLALYELLHSADGPDLTTKVEETPPPSPSREPDAVALSGSPGLPRVPGYELLAEIGRGGMGVVYQARHRALKRLVAVKVIRAAEWAPAPELARFRNEAEVIARLQHPNIVQIYEVGEHAGCPYLTLEYVDSGSLDKYLDGTPQPPRWAAELVKTLAAAMHHAHQRGIVHRDLKPANILLASGGCQSPGDSARPGDSLPPLARALPKIADFGLAKLLSPGTAAPTQSGAIVGTPHYMAPEQAAGANREVGPATDVYALGAILYELLTGRRPFQAATQLEVMVQVAQREPPRPRTIHRPIDIDLETICLKCLEKEPKKRYPSAAALAEDLERWLAGVPIRARSVGPGERLRRWCRRNPALATVSGLALAALAAALVVAVCFALYQTQAAKEQAQAANDLRTALDRVQDREQFARREQRATQAALAENYLERGLVACDKDADAGSGLLWLARALETVPPEKLERDRIIRQNLASWQGSLCPLQSVFSQPGRIQALAFSPDGQAVLIGGNDGTARLWSAGTGKPLAPPLKHQGPVNAVAFRPDGRAVLTGSSDGTAQLWSADTGQRRGPPLKHQSPVNAVAFRPDGKVVLTGSMDRTARLWSAATGQPLGPPLRHQDVVLAVAFSPDGNIVLTRTWESAAWLWSAATGQPLGSPLSHQESVNAFAFSPDGRAVLTGSNDGTARLWAAATGKPLGPVFRHHGAVRAVAFSPDGRTVLTAGDDNTARLWAVATGEAVGAPMGHQSWIQAVAFSPDGRAVLTGSADTTARVWSAATGQPLGPPLRHPSEVWAVAFSPNGRAVLTTGYDPTARLWSVVSGQPASQLLRHQGTVNSVAFSPDGRAVLTASSNGTALLWSAGTGKPLSPPLRHQNAVNVVAFRPDGRAVLTASADGTARLWSAATGRPLGPPMRHQGFVYDAAFSPDGKTVLTGSQDTTAQLWSAATGQPAAPPLRHLRAVRAVAFSPNGKIVATGSFDTSARLWSAATGKAVGPALLHPGFVNAVAFSPDGKTLLTGSWDSAARLWSAATGKVIAPTLRHHRQVWAAAFSPDGQTVATGSWDNTARLWSAATGRPLSSPLRHQGYVNAVAFSPDDKILLTGSSDNTARLWSTSTGRPLGPPLRHQGPVWAVAFSPDGQRVLTGSADGTARLWRVGKAYDGDAQQIRLRIQVATGTEFDAHGAVGVLDGLNWQRRRQELWQGAQPALPTHEDIRAWHRREAQEAAIARNWFAAVWHLNAVVDAAPAVLELRRDRAHAYLELENWAKAAEDTSKLCALAGPDFASWAAHARLQLYFRKDASYRQACAQLLRKWGQGQDRSVAHSIAWVCALGPNSVTDYQPVLRLAEMAVAKLPKDAGVLGILGAILHRAGRPEDAVKRLQEAIAKSPAKRGLPENWLFLALVHQQLGHMAEAKKCLARAAQLLDQAKNLSGEQRLDLQILRREAETRIHKPLPKEAHTPPERN
jgi:WD40 repeat protein/tetratricopeptide (TPR) repeat protein/tRNA A-37 threonylcarbamoyl transferase component Bud32